MVYQTVIDMLAASGAAYTIHRHPPVTTIEEARAKVPHLTRNLLKTIAFRIKDGDWILAAVSGAGRIDYKKLAAAVGLKRTALRSIAPAEVATQLGFEIGGVGPFPVRPDVRVVFDDRLPPLGMIFCGSGSNTRTVEMQMADLLELTCGKVAPILRSNGGIEGGGIGGTENLPKPAGD
jgi:Cys-tRNA(Pro)/Cys-tRNA(Cys) deacylase